MFFEKATLHLINMKNTLYILISLVYSISYAQYNIYKINDKIIIYQNNKKKELEGIGTTFMNNLNFEKSVDEKGVEIKKAWLWIRGCGKVYFENDSKILLEKSGSLIKVRFGSSNCVIKSWEKF